MSLTMLKFKYQMWVHKKEEGFYFTLMYGWKTEGECEAITNLVKTRASIFKFEVEDLSCEEEEIYNHYIRLLEKDRVVL